MTSRARKVLPHNLPYISAVSPLYLRCISPISPLARCENKAAFTEWTTLIKNIEDPKLTFHRKSVVGDLAR